MLMARRLFDAESAILSGLVLSTSIGYYSFAHDARPDMLYAFCCGAGLLGFLVARDASAANRSTFRGAMVMWASYGLATLTKGPQMPALLVVATGTFCALRRMGWRTTLRLHRPFAGVLVLAAITVPWWVAVHLALGGDGLRGTQLAGSLLTARNEQTVSLYYLGRPLKFLLPWAVLLPAVPWLLAKPLRTSAALQFLACVIVIPPLLLSFGPQHRVHYVLPCLGAASILLARAGIVAAERAQGRPALQRVLAWLPPLHWISVVVAAIVLGFVAERAGADTRTRAIVTVTVLAALGLAAHRARPVAMPVFLQLGLVFVVGLVGLGASEPLWSLRRIERVELGQQIRERIQPTTTVLVLGGGRAAIGYFAGRRLRGAKGVPDLVKRVQEADDAPIAAILLPQTLRSLPATIAVAKVPPSSEPHPTRRILVLLRNTQRGPHAGRPHTQAQRVGA
jgi:4-amino-4-deoxy-L-arabinose transferase-like glycosyltransferase